MSLAEPLSYIWKFSNGLPNETTTTPSSKTYNTDGTYGIKLVVKDVNNCSDSTTRNVSIENPVSGFNAPAVVCFNTPVTYTNTSTSGFYEWGFDAGTLPSSSFQTNPSVTYTTPGTHTITLTTISGSCSNKLTKTIFVEQPSATFTTNPTYSCSQSQAFNFFGSSPNTVSAWNWTLGDGTTKTGQNISHTFSAPKGQQTVLTSSLSVITNNGCTSNTFKFNDTLFYPLAKFNVNNNAGCTPLNVTFTESSISKEPIVSWEWNFGDGSPLQTGQGPQTHVYSSPGNYLATLTITNNKSCKDVSSSVIIQVGQPLNLDFTADKFTVCPEGPVTFTNLTTIPLGIGTVLWDYSSHKESLPHSPFNPSPTVEFVDSVGYHNITLRAENNGCISELTKLDYIYVNGAIADFKYTINCDDPFVVEFTDKSQDATALSWNFDDGSPLSSATGSFTYTYSTKGDYNVKITATNTLCPNYERSTIVRIRDIIAAFSANSLVCKGNSTVFDASSSQDEYPINGVTYTWMFNDPSISTVTTNSVTASIRFPHSGKYNVNLIVSDINECKDTAKQEIFVFSVNAAFTVSDNSICFPLQAPITFTNQSSADTIISKIEWRFGDGSPDKVSLLPLPLSITTYSYTTGTNSFNTRLIVTDSLGCKDTATALINIYKPTSSVSPGGASNICLGKVITLTSSDFTSQGSNLSFTWDFGDGSQIALGRPVTHTYSAAGSYNVKLVYTENATGCKDSTSSKVVNVQAYPIAGFTAENSGILKNNNDTVCFDNPQLLFTNTSTITPVSFLNKFWDLGTGNFISNDGPVGLPFPKGSHLIRLRVSTSFGCSDTTEKTFHVVGPTGDFDYYPIICRSDELKLTAKDLVDVGLYSWDFGDGTPFVSNVSPVSHYYSFTPASNSFRVLLNLSGINGVCPIAVEHTVNVYDVKARFNRNSNTDIDTAVCFNQPITIINNSSSLANSFKWEYGDGKTSTLAPGFTHNYDSPGTYSVKLMVSSSNPNCYDTIIKKVVVYQLPNGSAIGDTVCRYTIAKLNVTNYNATHNYSWLPITGLNNPTIHNPQLTLQEPQFFNLTITDINNCQTKSSAFVDVIQPLKPISFDTSIVLGDSIKLPITKQNSKVNFFWNPETGLSCTDCPMPQIQPLEDITYNVLMKDICTEATGVFVIDVKPEMFIALPTTFSPNGDGSNDIIFVKGWGVKELISFEVYNRWGELVFKTNDINEGWNGFYKGVLQNNDTYVYKVKAKTWRNTEVEKEGHFNLMR